jgi:hypothetical protein
MPGARLGAGIRTEPARFDRTGDPFPLRGREKNDLRFFIS